MKKHIKIIEKEKMLVTIYSITFMFPTLTQMNSITSERFNLSTAGAFNLENVQYCGVAKKCHSVSGSSNTGLIGK